MKARHRGGADSELADNVDDVVRDNEWIERVTRVGWLAKAIVYTLMGATAFQIARQDPVADEASPEGSIGRIAEAPLGRLLLAVLAVGLVLYAMWRLLSVAVIRGGGAAEWGDRIGYSFSAIFYLVLAYSAGKSAISGIDPEGSSTVESISSTLLDVTAGRYLLGLGGVVTMAIGAYFTVHKGIRRSFVDDLDSVRPSLEDNESKRNLMVISGVVGWIGRGIVTMLVGFFVLRSAWVFDPDEARGFDRALREVAGTGTGSMLVFASAIGLIVYGAFCFLTHRARTLGST